MSANNLNSEQIKQQLNGWYAGSKYEDIKFFIAPNVETSVDEVAAEVLKSITRFENGELKKVSTEVF